VLTLSCQLGGSIYYLIKSMLCHVVPPCSQTLEILMLIREIQRKKKERSRPSILNKVFFNGLDL
jgi:hypothetical protein